MAPSAAHHVCAISASIPALLAPWKFGPELMEHDGLQLKMVFTALIQSLTESWYEELLDQGAKFGHSPLPEIDWTPYGALADEAREAHAAWLEYFRSDQEDQEPEKQNRG